MCRCRPEFSVMTVAPFRSRAHSHPDRLCNTTPTATSSCAVFSDPGKSRRCAWKPSSFCSAPISWTSITSAAAVAASAEPCSSARPFVGTGVISDVGSWNLFVQFPRMATKTITLKLDAHERRRTAKKAGESFSEVVRRASFADDRDLFFGWKDVTSTTIETCGIGMVVFGRVGSALSRSAYSTTRFAAFVIRLKPIDWRKRSKKFSQEIGQPSKRE